MKVPVQVPMIAPARESTSPKMNENRGTNLFITKCEYTGPRARLAMPIKEKRPMTMVEYSYGGEASRNVSVVQKDENMAAVNSPTMQA